MSKMPNIIVSLFMRSLGRLCIGWLALTPSILVLAENGEVNITANINYVDTLHKGERVRIQRIQDTNNLLPFEYSRTSRACPPFCIQPMLISPGVETIAELELLGYLKRIGEKDTSILVIDSREMKWVENGMIPGSIHLPWTLFHAKTATPASIARLLESEFDALPNKEIWDFNDARTLVFYCNGPWCGQSPSSIRSLLSAGYPADRIKWYRGGMQSWLQFGLTVVKPKQP